MRFQHSSGFCVPHALFNATGSIFSKRQRFHIKRQLGSPFCGLGALSAAMRFKGWKVRLEKHPALDPDTLDETFALWRADSATVLIADGTHCVSVRSGWVFDAAEPFALPLSQDTLRACGFALPAAARWDVRVIQTKK